MCRNFKCAPLPFVGQKRFFVRDFAEVLGTVKNEVDTVVDLFGGSGLLSHTAKAALPDARVIYNDFDGYSERIANIPVTNRILAEIRPLLADMPHNQRLPGELKERILGIVAKYAEEGFVDYSTVSRSLLFSGKWAKSLDDMCKHSFYNGIRQSDYNAEGYLDGLEVVSMDYRELFARHRDNPQALFILDPPYLSTDCGMYEGWWKLRDYLDVLKLLPGTRYIYFTSEKSQLVELCEWLGTNHFDTSPMDGAEIRTRQNTINYNASFQDIMVIRV